MDIHEVLCDYLEKSEGILFCYLSNNGKIIDCNEAFARVIGTNERPNGIDIRVFLESELVLSQEYHVNDIWLLRTQSGYYRCTSHVFYVENHYTVFLEKPLLFHDTIVEKMSVLSMQVNNLARELQSKNSELCSANRKLLEEIGAREQLEAEKLALLEKTSRNERLAALGTLISGICHELNQPLNAMYVSTSALLYLYNKERKITTEEVMEDLSAVVDNIKRVKGIISRFRDIFENSISLEEGFIDWSKLLTDVIDEWQHFCTVRKITLRLQAASTSTLTIGNEGTMREAMRQLLINAIQILEMTDTAEKIILVRNCMNEQYVFVEICDNGPGIDEEVKDKIFNPFFTTKEVGQGMGLGLTLVHWAVTNSHGEIKVFTDGHGARFQLKFPRTSPKGCE